MCGCGCGRGCDCKFFVEAVAVFVPDPGARSTPIVVPASCVLTD